jgi:hypothetical protein
MAPTTTSPREPTASTGPPVSPDDAAVRIVFQALRTLVPEEGIVTLSDVLAVTRLDPEEASAAMDSLAQRGPFAVSRDAAAPPAWHVRRTDR